MENKTNPIEQLESLAIQRIKETLVKEPDKVSDRELEIAKLASSTRSTNSRLSATKRVQDATQLSIIKTITEDPEERKKYVKATLPEYCPKV
jgi:hypothetical protein